MIDPLSRFILKQPTGGVWQVGVFLCGLILGRAAGRGEVTVELGSSSVPTPRQPPGDLRLADQSNKQLPVLSLFSASAVMMQEIAILETSVRTRIAVEFLDFS